MTTSQALRLGVGRYPARTVLRREQAHRRALLLGIATLLVLSTGPVLGHHLSARLDALLAQSDHVGALCLIALHYLLAPVHELFHWLVGIGLAYAVWNRAQAARRLRETLKRVPWQAPVRGDRAWIAAAAAGVDPARLRMVDRLPNPAFTVGWIRPVTYLSRELVDRLAHAELGAVLSHEAAHVARRDPLRLALVRFLSHTLFWLPAMRRMADDVADEAEIAADDAAARESPLVLASALIAIADGFRDRSLSTAVVGLHRADHADLLERRVRRLAGEDVTIRSRVTRRSIVFAATVMVLSLASGVAVTHPLPPLQAATTAHCAHPTSSVITHLFCRFGSDEGECPHHAG